MVRAARDGRAGPHPHSRRSRSTCSRSRSSPRSAAEEWDEDALFALLRGAYPYRDLAREEFDDVVAMLAAGYTTRRGRRAALVHHDAINRKLRAPARVAHDRDHLGRRDPRGVRLPRAARARGRVHRHAERGLRHRVAARAISSSSAIRRGASCGWQRRGAGGRRAGPAAVDAVLARRGALAQRRGERGRLAPARRRRRAAAGAGRPRARTARLERAVAWLAQDYELPRSAAEQIAAYLAEGKRALGVVPSARNARRRALLRRERRHAARPARAVRQPRQPRLGPRAAQEVLPELQLRAAGRGHRRRHHPVARLVAFVPARWTCSATFIRTRCARR